MGTRNAGYRARSSVSGAARAGRGRERTEHRASGTPRYRKVSVSDDGWPWPNTRRGRYRVDDRHRARGHRAPHHGAPAGGLSGCGVSSQRWALAQSPPRSGSEPAPDRYARINRDKDLFPNWPQRPSFRDRSASPLRISNWDLVDKPVERGAASRTGDKANDLEPNESAN